MNKFLTYKRVKELLYYNFKTGDLFWRVYRNQNVLKNTKAGSLKSTGYIDIKIDNKIYKAHRIIWLYMKGYIPENEIDHIDRNPSNNKWDNLREVSRQCNMRNSSIRKDNTSGVTGVSFLNVDKKWLSYIQEGGRRKRLGLYVSFDEAVKARWDAEVKYKWPNCQTFSSAYLYLKEKDLL